MGARESPDFSVKRDISGLELKAGSGDISLPLWRTTGAAGLACDWPLMAVPVRACCFKRQGRASESRMRPFPAGLAFADA